MITGLPKRTVLGSCELRCILGRGGSAISYLAYDRVLERPVVIKEHFPMGLCIRPKGQAEVEATDEELYERSLATFCHEARLLAGLNHSNIVKVHDIFEASGTAYIIMDYAEGQMLQDWLPLHAENFPAVQELLCKLLQTLDYLHSNNILHRDVKPSNIIVQEGNKPILLDFGSAHVGMVNYTLTAVGSPGFSAPEQFSPHGRTGPWSDLYGLAQSFLHLLPEKKRRTYPRSFMKPLLQAAMAEPKARPQNATQWLNAMRIFPYKRLSLAGGMAIFALLGIWALSSLLLPTREETLPSTRNLTQQEEKEMAAILQQEEKRYSDKLQRLQNEYSKNNSMTKEEYQQQRILYEKEYLRNTEDIKQNFHIREDS